VKIVDQEWCSKNLNVSKFRNGETIPQAKTAAEWKNAADKKQPAWCYYDNNPANEKNNGKLYNWYAVNDPRGLAPIGFHVASKEEWEIIEYSLGLHKTGEKMKSTSGWKSYKWFQYNYSGNGTNSSGFNAFPGGCRSNDEKSVFSKMGEECLFWSSTILNEDINAHISALIYNKVQLETSSVADLSVGAYVRCIKDK
jgi:uncharacterized protein (TIGR02145 family)